MLFPPVGLFVALAKGYHIRFDPVENYVKQSIRNRYHILGANGVQTLTIAVMSQGGNKISTGKIRINYDKPWQREHKRSIESAYRSSPFYEHYESIIFDLIDSRHSDFQAYFNMCFSSLCKIIGLSPKYSIENSYVADQDFSIDLRPRIKFPHQFPTEFSSQKYLQVFADRFPFQPNLSIIDLIFNEGPATLATLKS